MNLEAVAFHLAAVSALSGLNWFIIRLALKAKINDTYVNKEIWNIFLKDINNRQMEIADELGRIHIELREDIKELRSEIRNIVKKEPN